VSERSPRVESAAGNAPDFGLVLNDASRAGATTAGAELSEGHIIAGKYRIERVIGTGGMGVVHLAVHVALDEPVAIKVLRPVMMAVPGMVTRFTREARAASKIKSEHVARVTDVDTLPTGVPYMVMEYLEGIDLAALRRKVGPLPIGEAATYIAQACDAIGEAHKLGIVHRDLKPSNLFLAQRRDDRRAIKVLDFGISKVESPSEEDTTQTGMTMGSPKYMSPEQMRSMRDTDSRTDIWSLGAILYELLAGRPPFIAQSMAQVCALVLHGEPPPLRTLRPDVPPSLEAIVARCLDKAPGARFATAADLARSLAPFLDMMGESGAIQIEEDIPISSEASPSSARTSSATAPTVALACARPSSSSSPTGTLATAHALSTASVPRRSKRAVVVALAVALALGGGALLLSRGSIEQGAAPPTAAGEPVATDGRAAAAPVPTSPPAHGERGLQQGTGASRPDVAATPPRPLGVASAVGAVAARAVPGASPPSVAPSAAGTSGDRRARSTTGAPSSAPRRDVDPFGGSRN
jgi:eukaryotic-like serine/threonine-protein kinase